MTASTSTFFSDGTTWLDHPLVLAAKSTKQQIEDTAQVKQLFYNSTYYYPDRVAMLWFLENATERQQSPVMELGSGGALTGGAANIWHWQSAPTDNNPIDTGFPGGYTNPSGTPIFPADNLSFAEDDYTNTTGYFVIP
jgi:cytochrome b558/566 subunit A